MILIVDYDMGNVSAIRNMLSRIGVTDVVISADPQYCLTADKIILPGVGAFDAAVGNLEDRALRAPLVDAATRRRVPVLGICLGMQLLGEGSEEGTKPGLALIPGTARRFDASLLGRRMRIPHMGWNDVKATRPHPLLAGFADERRFYFVHSFHFVCRDAADSIGETDYGRPFTSVIAHGNITGVQFHPEKSHQFGMTLLSNFAKAA
jgi:imidazole glycerol-phosphate synthase subunit HisH